MAKTGIAETTKNAGEDWEIRPLFAYRTHYEQGLSASVVGSEAQNCGAIVGHDCGRSVDLTPFGEWLVKPLLQEHLVTPSDIGAIVEDIFRSRDYKPIENFVFPYIFAHQLMRRVMRDEPELTKFDSVQGYNPELAAYAKMAEHFRRGDGFDGLRGAEGALRAYYHHVLYVLGVRIKDLALQQGLVKRQLEQNENNLVYAGVPSTASRGK